MKVWHVLQENSQGNLDLYEGKIEGRIDLIDVLDYAPSPPLFCYIDITGNVAMSEVGKVTGHRYKIFHTVDATNILHEFACICAEDAFKAVKNPDHRSVAMVKAKRDWVAGRIDSNQLQTAVNNAWAAVEDAKTDLSIDAARAAWALSAKDAVRVARAMVKAVRTVARHIGVNRIEMRNYQNQVLTKMVTDEKSR